MQMYTSEEIRVIHEERLASLAKDNGSREVRKGYKTRNWVSDLFSRVSGSNKS